MEVGGEPQAQVDALARRHHEAVVKGGLGAGIVGIGRVLSVHHVAVKRVLGEGRSTGGPRAVDRLGVRLVVGEKRLAHRGAKQVTMAELVLEVQLARRKHVVIVRGEAHETGTRSAGDDPWAGAERPRSSSRCFETTGGEGCAGARPRDRDCGRAPASRCLRRSPSRTRLRCRSTGRRRRSRCRGVRTRGLRRGAPGSRGPAARRETRAGDTCRATSCTSGWADCRGRSSTPSRPRRDSLPREPRRRGAP